MARGPKPKPAAVRAQTKPVRSVRKPPEAEAASAVTAKIGGAVAPNWLKGKGLDLWNAMAPTLAQAKLLTAADVGAFGRYCRNFARWIELSEDLDKVGATYLSKSNHGELLRAHPAAMLMFRIEALLMATEDRFGLNPAERQRIMAARMNAPGLGDLFGTPLPAKPDDPVAKPTQPAQAVSDDGPIGFLN